ncbi:hypothetical protein [Frigidibacter sp. MR17.24]
MTFLDVMHDLALRQKLPIREIARCTGLTRIEDMGPRWSEAHG